MRHDSHPKRHTRRDGQQTNKRKRIRVCFPGIHDKLGDVQTIYSSCLHDDLSMGRKRTHPQPLVRSNITAITIIHHSDTLHQRGVGKQHLAKYA